MINIIYLRFGEIKMICKNCGAKVDDGALKCPKCGFQDFATESDKTELLLESDKTALLNNDKTELLPEFDKTELLSDNATEYSGGILDEFDETYKILGKIGEGGGGVVYKALHTRLNKEVVIKQIISSNASLNRNETDLLKKLKHSYLPQVLDFIEKYGKAYTVMDFISGSDIERLAASGRKFKSREIIRIGIQLCEAVNYLHTQNPPIIHSDIKPANVMLTDNGDICLIDFNVSLIFDKSAKTIGGTRGYASPEQLGIPISDVGNDNVSIEKVTPVINERCDVYSIGAFLYFLITGEAPAANYKRNPLGGFAKKIPDGLYYIVTKATALSPAKRYKNAGEMLNALKNIGKLDRRYKALKVRRAIATVLAVVLIAGCAELNRMGSRKLSEEHEEKYQGYISEITQKVASGDFEGAKSVISTAEEFEPTRIEPYYNNAKILYIDKKYEECMNYPDSVITAEISEKDLNSADFLAEMYEMAADSAFELENYEKAIFQYENALRYSEKLVDCYRDLTISHARLGQIESAEASLETARSKGISSDILELMQGEICAAKGDVNAAFESFVKTLTLTDDDYIRFRAILVCDKTMIADSDNAKSNGEKMIDLLQKQLPKVSSEYEGVVTEMLANEYARAEQYDKAAATYESLLNSGTLGYSLQKNYYNLLYSKLQDYDKCLNLLANMGEANPEDYWVDMNECFVRISVENGKKNQTERDYSAAYECFKSAEQKYKAFTLNGKTDANMDNLRESIRELKAYGWIKED